MNIEEDISSFFIIFAEIYLLIAKNLTILQKIARVFSDIIKRVKKNYYKVCSRISAQ